MTFYQGLATVLLRVWAATMLIESIRWVMDFGISWTSQSDSATPETSQYLLGALASGATYLAVAVVIWICARPIGRWVGSAIAVAEPVVTFSAGQIVAVGSFLIGVFFVVEYAPQAAMDTVISLAKHARTSDAERLYGSSVDLYNLRQLTKNWAVVIAALALAFRARDIGRLFAWLRETGLSKPERVEN